ncbi:MAG: hypothetical protein AB9872_11755 [Solidesulfovibrio sp.]
MKEPRSASGDGRFLGVVTAAACHDLMNHFATFTQALGLMEDCLAADARTKLRSFGLKGGFEHKARFQELIAMLHGQLERAVGMTEALALAAHSVDREGRTASPPDAVRALLVLGERLLKRQKVTAAVETPASPETPWPSLRQADYLGPLLEVLLACLPHLPMGGKLRLACRAEAGALTVTIAPGEGRFSDDAQAAGLAAARAAGVDAAPGESLTLVFQEQPTSTPASRPPDAGQAS